MEYLNPVYAYKSVQQFLNTGGSVLFWIMLLAFFLSSFILERFAYYGTGHKPFVQRLKNEWKNRSDKTSWNAKAIRDEMVSEVKKRTEQNVAVIKTLVAAAPLFGLLGTVTGMIAVFDVMALSGASNARDMAGGVFKATIPTMAGMTIAIFGLLFSTYIERKARTETAKFAEELGYL